jgi:hypothetical protein
MWGTAIGWLLAFAISVHAITNRAVDLPVFIDVPAILVGFATLALDSGAEG